MSQEVEVLILDDEPVVCERLEAFLKKKGMLVETFTESKRALERLKEKTFDVVVTDIKMEGPSGIDVLSRVKRDASHSEVILITGYGSFETLREAEAIGAYDYIPKPFKVEELFKKIEKAAARARKRAK